MNKIYKIKDFNLNNLKSNLLKNMTGSDEENDMNELDVQIEISLNDVNDFNNRVVNPKNINNIIKICDFFLIENTEEFLILNSTPTLEKYIIDELEVNKNGIIEKIKKYNLPIFMTDGLSDWYYYKKQKINYEYDYYERKLCAIQDMASYGLIDWIKLLLENKSFSTTFELPALYAANNNKLECIKYLIDNNLDNYTTDVLNAAAYGGHLNIVKFLIKKGCEMNKTTCYLSALGNHLHCLKYAYDNNCPWDFKTLSNAAIINSLECMKFAFENGCKFVSSEDNDYNFDERENACEEAASNGNLECLKYAYYNKCPLGLSLENAARFGNLDCLKFVWTVIEKNPKNMNGEEERIYNLVLKTLCRVAIKSENLEVLKYCYEVIGDKKLDLDAREEVMYAYCTEVNSSTALASEFKNSDILNYLLENNLKLDKDCFKTAITNNSINCMKYIFELPNEINKICFENKESFYDIAFENSSYDALIFLKENNFSICNEVILTNLKNKLTFKFATDNNIKIIVPDEILLNKDKWFTEKYRLEIMKENNIFWNEKLSSIIAKNGQLSLLKYLHENNCPWDLNTTISASENYNNYSIPDMYEIPDKLGCLKYAIENDCPFNILTAYNASHNLDMIKYLYKKNLKMNSSVYENAIKKYKLDVIKFLFSIGIKLNESLLILVFDNCFCKDIFNFLVDNIKLTNSKLYDYIISSSYHDDNKIKCIKKLIENNCPSNLNNLKTIAKKSSMAPHIKIQIFKLIHNHNKNIEMDEELFKEAYKRPDDVFKYLLEIKAPFYQKYLKLYNEVQQLNRRAVLILDPNDTEYEFSSNEEYPDDY